MCSAKKIERDTILFFVEAKLFKITAVVLFHLLSSDAWNTNTLLFCVGQSHWKLQRSASSISVLTPVTDIHPITAQPDYWYTWSIKDIVSRSFHSDTFFSLFQMLKPLDRPTRKYQFRGEKNKKKFLHSMTALQHTLNVLYNMLWFWTRCSCYACFGFVGQLKSCMAGFNFAWIVYGVCDWIHKIWTWLEYFSCVVSCMECLEKWLADVLSLETHYLWDKYIQYELGCNTLHVLYLVWNAWRND